MLVLQFCPQGLWVQKTRRDQSRVLSVPGKRSGCCRATLLCSLSFSRLVPTSMETSHLLPVKGTKHAEEIEPACCNPSFPLCFLSHQYIFPSFYLPLALVDALDSLAMLPERTSLLFPAHSSTPAVTVISRPHLPLATSSQWHRSHLYVLYGKLIMSFLVRVREVCVIVLRGAEQSYELDSVSSTVLKSWGVSWEGIQFIQFGRGWGRKTSAL